MKQSLLSRFWLGLLVFVLPACTLTAPAESGPITFSGAPVVEIISPAPNNTYFEGVGVNIQVSVSNAGSDIARVEFSVDNVVIGTSESPNTAGSAIFSVSQRWTAEGEGEHTAGVTAFRADGSTSVPTTVAFNVLAPAPEETEEPTRQTNTSTTSGGSTSGGSTSGGAQATQAPAASATPAPTTEVPPTEAPAATATSTGPQLTTNIGINVRSGPNVLFNPPLGGMAAGETVPILAVSTGRDWYKIRYFSSDGWVFSGNVTTSGDLSGLPVEAGPALPTAVPATAVPAATTPPTGGITGGSCAGAVAGGSNLCVSALSINGGGQPFCGTPTTVVVTVGNNGSAATGTGFFVTATVTKTSDNGQVFINTASTSAIIPAGGTTQVTVGGAPFTHMTGGGQTFRVTITFNPNGNTDANTADSTFATTYTLGGSC